METFGERLQVLRTERQLSQERFAEIMDVSRQSISKWENDKAYPEMSKLIFMSEFFDVTIDYLVLGNDSVKSVANDIQAAGKMEALWKSINSFFSNLNNKQKFVIGLLCVSIIAIGFCCIYGAGYAIGIAFYHILH